MKKPKLELLKDAYAILDGIPEKYYRLDSVIFKAENDCGTLACGIGWLSIHPQFSKKLKVAKINNSNIFPYIEWLGKDGEAHDDYGTAAANLFNLKASGAVNLFGSVNASWYDQFISNQSSDKTRLLKRIRLFLEEQQNG